MDPDLLWIKLINFTGVLGNVAWGRYQIMYLNAQGQSPMRNGMLRASGLLAKFFATPIWGAMGDRYPPAQPLMASVLLCVVMLDAYRWKSVSTSFWALLVLKIGRSACNGVGTLTDIITLRTIEHKKESGGYGSQRQWAGVAWGCGSAVVGYFIDRYGYDAIFIWTYVFNGLLIVLLLRKPGGSGNGGAVESGGKAGEKEFSKLEEGSVDGGGRGGGSGGGSPRGKPSKHRPRSISAMLSSYAAYASRRSVWQFLLMLICYGIVMSLVEAVQFLQMEREFHLPKSYMGTVTFIGTMAEFPCFSYGKRVISKYGHNRVLKFAHAACAVRLVLLSCVTSSTTSLYMFIQPLHGITFGLFWSAAVDYAFISAPNDLKATSQGVVSTSYYIVGSGFGAVLWSAVFEHESFGARYAYTMGAVMVSLTGYFLLGGGQGCGKAVDAYVPQHSHAPGGGGPSGGSAPSWTTSKMVEATRKASEDEPMSPTLEGAYLLGALSDEQEREKLEREEDALCRGGALGGADPTTRQPDGGGDREGGVRPGSPPPRPDNRGHSPISTAMPKGAATSSDAHGRLAHRATRTPGRMPGGVAIV